MAGEASDAWEVSQARSGCAQTAGRQAGQVMQGGLPVQHARSRLGKSAELGPWLLLERVARAARDLLLVFRARHVWMG